MSSQQQQPQQQEQEQQHQFYRSGRSSTSSSANSGYSTSGWLELTHTPRDDVSSVTSAATTFLPLTVAASTPIPQRNVTEEERRLFLLRARNN